MFHVKICILLALFSTAYGDDKNSSKVEKPSVDGKPSDGEKSFNGKTTSDGEEPSNGTITSNGEPSKGTISSDGEEVSNGTIASDGEELIDAEHADGEKPPKGAERPEAEELANGEILSNGESSNDEESSDNADSSDHEKPTGDDELDNDEEPIDDEKLSDGGDGEPFHHGKPTLDEEPPGNERPSEVSEPSNGKFSGHGKPTADEEPGDDEQSFNDGEPSGEEKPNGDEETANAEEPSDDQKLSDNEEYTDGEESSEDANTSEGGTPSEDADSPKNDHSQDENRPELSSPWDKLPKECGKNRFHDEAKELRVVDDMQAKLGQFPWIARLGKKLFEYGLWFDCAGSLINRYYVVSAAHCDNDYDIVRLGENYVSANPDCDESGDCAPPHQDIGISRVIFQDFCRNEFENDLMLIELQNPAGLNDYVQPICFTRTPVEHHIVIDQYVTMAGFRAVHSEGKEPDHLRYVVNAVIQPIECEKLFKEPMGDSQFCIGTPGYVRSNGSCSGDSGGPAMKEIEVNGETRTYLIGAVSYGAEKCEYGPSIYTDVTYFGEWILNHIEKY